MPIHKDVNKDFFKKWSPDMAYFLGFFFADGSLDVNPRGSHYFNLQITDRELLYELRSLLNSNHKIAVRRRRGNEADQYRLQIGSREMCDDLRSLGVTECKSSNMLMPQVPAYYLSDFVRGYFDGDGNVWVGQVHKERSKSNLSILSAFTSSSKNFLFNLRVTLVTAGLSRGSFYAKAGAYKLQYSINDSIMLYHLMYRPNLEGPHLERKKKVFEKFIDMR